MPVTCCLHEHCPFGSVHVDSNDPAELQPQSENICTGKHTSTAERVWSYSTLTNTHSKQMHVNAIIHTKENFSIFIYLFQVKYEHYIKYKFSV